MICEGIMYGARIVRCSSCEFAKSYFHNLEMLYKLVGYVDPCRTDDRIEEDRNVLAAIALEVYGRQTFFFF